MIKVAIISTNRSAYSETFIKTQIAHLPFEVIVYSEGYLPTEISYDRGQSYEPLKFKGNLFKRTNNDRDNFERSLKENNVEVVLAQYGLAGVEVMDSCKQLNIPLIVHFHGFDAFREDVLSYHGSSYKSMFDYASSILSVSNAMSKQLISLGCPQEKLIRVNYGVNTTQFKLGKTKNTTQLLACGRFVKKKSPMNTVKAFQIVAREFPDVNLVMVGDGELLDETKLLVDQLNLTERVIFKGVLTQEEVIREMQSSFAFLQHSIKTPEGDSEGTPLSIIEASACALPIVSTKHAGIPEAVENNVTGLLVEEGDSKAMADKIIYLLKHQDEAQKMGEEGRKKVVLEYNRDKYIKALSEAINRVIN